MGGAVASIILRSLSNSRELLKSKKSNEGGASCPRDINGRLLPPTYVTIEKTEIIRDKSGNVIETKITYFKEIM